MSWLPPNRYIWRKHFHNNQLAGSARPNFWMQQRFHLAYGLIYWPLLGVTLFSPTQRRLVIVQVVHRKPMIRVRSGWISTAIAGLKAHDEVKCDAAALKRVRSSTVATGDDLVIIRNNAIWKSLNFFQGPIYARRLLWFGPYLNGARLGYSVRKSKQK